MKLTILVAILTLATAANAQNRPNILAVNDVIGIGELFCPASPNRSGSLILRSTDDSDFNTFIKIAPRLKADGICNKIEALRKTGTFAVLTNAYSRINFPEVVELVDASDSLTDLRKLEAQLLNESFCRDGLVSCRKAGSDPASKALCVPIQYSQKPDCGLPR